MKYAPYVKLYTDILDECGCEYDIAIWDKCNLHEDVTYSYHGKKNDGKMIKSFFQYIGFGSFISKILQRNDYEKLIVCNPAPLIFVKGELLKKYKGKFIWDIRDDTPIRKVFKKRFAEICRKAIIIVTSSRRYEEWINRETILSHNANKDMIHKYFDYLPTYREKTTTCLINAGKMIEQEENIRVLRCLGNRSEYRFIYYGSDVPGKLELMEYCQKNKLSNVEFFGTYDKNEIINIYRHQGDLVNILRANTAINRDALPNKLYEAVMAGVPIVVYEHNTAIASYVNEFHLGIVLKNDSEVELIANKLSKFDYESYNEGRKAFLRKILDDIDAFERTVRSFVES